MEEVFYTKTGILLYLIKSKNRRTISIVISHDLKVKIYLPYKTKQNTIDDVIKQKEAWITKKLSQLRERYKQDFVKKEYKEGEKFYLLGRQYSVSVLHENKNVATVMDDKILLSIKQNYDTFENRRKIIFNLFKNMAQEVFLERLLINFKIFANIVKNQYNFNFLCMPELKVRNMKARFGSLRNKQIMTLNQKLIHVDTKLIDYVIMHELCHLKYSGHGKNFYILQSKVTPDWKVAKKELLLFNAELNTF